MDVEIIQTEEIAQKKKEATERQDLLEIDLKKMTQEFYCESCDKRYKTVSEMSNHLSSYDHHHRKVRFSGFIEIIVTDFFMSWKIFNCFIFWW